MCRKSEGTKSMTKNKPAGYGSGWGLLSQRMEQFQLLCQIRQILSPVSFGAPDALVTCHVLNLPYGISLEPVHKNT